MIIMTQDLILVLVKMMVKLVVRLRLEEVVVAVPVENWISLADVLVPMAAKVTMIQLAERAKRRRRAVKAAVQASWTSSEDASAPMEARATTIQLEERARKRRREAAMCKFLVCKFLSLLHLLIQTFKRNSRKRERISWL